jgi:ABC-2 type transport system ATP-binding protein
MNYEAAQKDTTVFVTTHYMDEAEYCDRVCIMVDGQIGDMDTPSRMKQRRGADNMNEVFLQLARQATRNAD